MIISHRLRRWLVLFGLWTLAGLTYTGAQYVAYVENNRQWPNMYPAPALAPMVLWNLVAFYLWAALSPSVILFARQFPIEGLRRWRNLLLHVPAAAIIILIHTSLWSTLRWNFFLPPIDYIESFSELLRQQLSSGLFTKIMLYTIILVVIHALKYHREFAAEQLKASELRAHLAGAQLQALKAQLHPHFLFNTINAVTELVYDSPAVADRILTQLSTLLRLSLKNNKEHEVPLKQELDFLRKYLEIQQTLLQERLVVNFRIEAGALDARVPNMILQPLVENAIRHGISQMEEGGTIEIEVRRNNGTLQVKVSDDGPGLIEEDGGEEAKGIGLANTQARLKHLYGNEHDFKLTATPGGGVTVGMVIPYRKDADESNGEYVDEDSRTDS